MDYTTSHFTWSILGYLWIPADQVSPGQTLGCPGACGSRQKGHVIILDQSQVRAAWALHQSNYMPIKIGALDLI